MKPVKNKLQSIVVSLIDQKNIDMMIKAEVREEVRFPVQDVVRVSYTAWRKVFYGR